MGRALRQKGVRGVLKLFGKHKDRAEQERTLAAGPLPRAAVATPARLEALRGRVPWGPRAVLLVDARPDAKSYTPFTAPDARADLAKTVTALLADTDVVFGAVDAGPWPGETS